MSVPVQEISFQVNGYQLAAREWHAGAKQKVIALHGWLDNAASFDVLAPLLPDCHIVALDMPGQGWSDHKSPQATYQLWDDLYDILSIAEQLAWPQFHLLAHSRGGMMAMMLAAVAPEQVHSAVLLDTVWPPPVTLADTVTQLSNHLKQRRALEHKRLPSYGSIDEAVQARCKAAIIPISEVAARPIIERGLELKGGRYYWRSDPRLTIASAMKLTRGHTDVITQSIKVPCLLLLGEQGIGGRDGVKELVASYTTIDSVFMAGSHHFHLEEQAPVIASKVMAFFPS